MDAAGARDLFTEMHREVHRYAARRSNVEVADEVVAETFAALWDGRERVPADLDGRRAWVYGIARRQLAAAQRRKHHEARLDRHVRAALRGGVPVAEPDAVASRWPSLTRRSRSPMPTRRGAWSAP